MGRPPCCDKDGIKKGPWTPEEDIILVSYIQEHGPGNWRSVPTNTGLLRCSKSCRLRWTNYLRPGIKRGNFTPHEEGMIVHLQALLGNKWAAIASYLPQRTDNDIKNYWNTHLKKKLKRLHSAFQQEPKTTALLSSSSPNSVLNHELNHVLHNQFSLKKECAGDITVQPLLPTSTCYASSTENISRLLENWMKCSPNSKENVFRTHIDEIGDNDVSGRGEGTRGGGAPDMIPHEDEDNKFESVISFNNLGNEAIGVTATATTRSYDSMDDIDEGCREVHDMENVDDYNNPPLSFLEKWLLDEAAINPSRHAVEEILQLPSIFL